MQKGRPVAVAKQEASPDPRLSSTSYSRRAPMKNETDDVSRIKYDLSCGPSSEETHETALFYKIGGGPLGARGELLTNQFCGD